MHMFKKACNWQGNYAEGSIAMSYNDNRNNAYVIKTTKRISVAKICRILFFGCFFLGILFANTLWKNEAAWIGYLQENTLKQSLDVLSPGRENLPVVAFMRLPVWTFLVLFGRKTFGIFIGSIYGAWEGFLLGFLLSASMLRHGISGVVVIFGMCFPQIIFYFIAFFGIYSMLFFIHGRRMKDAEQDFVSNKQDLTNSRYVGICVLLSMIYVLGILVESYVNYFFLKGISNFFL